ncbi:MAG TPA: protein kinase, partial [Planctomycetota bacterium]|nr:protein kinase [Planctomycetota bacterium]
MSTPVEDARREDRVFGHLLVQHQYITSEHLQECLAAQVAGAAAGTTPRLGEILLRKGYLTFEKLDQALAVLRESTILSCGACGYEAAVSAYDPSRQYICPAQTPGGPCRQPLGEKFVSGTAKATSRTLQTRVRDLPSDVAQAARNSKNVLGKYVLLGMLGRGGMGVVYKAFDTSLMRSVALKQLTLASDDDLKRFQREARTVAALKHPNIAAVYEFDTIDGKSVISMELIRGKPAHGLKLSVQSALRVVSEAAKAIDHAHAKGIIHRDLKPQNILVDEELKPHVLDFGLARAIQGGEKLTLSGMIVGTPSYMSPEQGSAEPGKVDRRTDVYGLGATLYHLLTGKPPFDGSTPVQILKKVLEEDPKPPRVHNPSIPKEVEAICLQAMDRDPARRYASAAELAADIESYLSGKPIRAHARSIATRLLRKAHRGRKTLVAIAGTAAVLTMAGIGWVVISKGDQAARVKQYLAAGDRLRAEGDYQHAVAEYSKAKGLDARNALVEERIVDCRAKLNEIERTRQAKLEEERSAKESAEAEQGRAEEGKRKAEEGQRKAEEAQRAAEEAERRADEERRQAEEARKAAEAEKVRTEAERREAERRAAEES